MKNIKQIAVSEPVHRKLKLFVVSEGFKTLNDGIAALLGAKRAPK